VVKEFLQKAASLTCNPPRLWMDTQTHRPRYGRHL